MKRNLLVLLLIVNAIVTTAQTKQKMEWEDEINAKNQEMIKPVFHQS